MFAEASRGLERQLRNFTWSLRKADTFTFSFLDEYVYVRGERVTVVIYGLLASIPVYTCTDPFI
eukprot:5029304-Prymnesium_polylepis.1